MVWWIGDWIDQAVSEVRVVQFKSKHRLVIDGGYGKLKGKTFRISNMGDESDETIAALLKSLDSALAETPKAAAA